MKFTTASTVIIVLTAFGSVSASGWGQLAKTAGEIGGDATSIGGKVVAKADQAASAAVAQSARTVKRLDGYFINNPQVQAIKPVQVGPSAGSSSSLAASGANDANQALIKSLEARIALGKAKGIDTSFFEGQVNFLKTKKPKRP